MVRVERYWTGAVAFCTDSPSLAVYDVSGNIRGHNSCPYYRRLCRKDEVLGFNILYDTLGNICIFSLMPLDMGRRMDGTDLRHA